MAAEGVALNFGIGKNGSVLAVRLAVFCSVYFKLTCFIGAIWANNDTAFFLN